MSSCGTSQSFEYDVRSFDEKEDRHPFVFKKEIYYLKLRQSTSCNHSPKGQGSLFINVKGECLYQILRLKNIRITFDDLKSVLLETCKCNEFDAYVECKNLHKTKQRKYGCFVVYKAKHQTKENFKFGIILHHTDEDKNHVEVLQYDGTSSGNFMIDLFENRGIIQCY